MKRFLTVAFLSVGALVKAQSVPEPGHHNPALNLAIGQWRFVSIGGAQVLAIARQRPYVKFESRNNTVTGDTGCNRFRGTYDAGDSSLHIKDVTSTRMACVEGSNEEQVLNVLNSTTGYKISGHELRLVGAQGVLAVLTRPHEEQTTRQKPLEK